MNKKIGCKSCGKVVKPKNGRLICCGFNEAIESLYSDPNRCEDCGGKLKGYYDDYFIKGCHCSAYSLYNGEYELDN